jgi:hypothetical protein
VINSIYAGQISSNPLPDLKRSFHTTAITLVWWMPFSKPQAVVLVFIGWWMQLQLTVSSHPAFSHHVLLQTLVLGHGSSPDKNQSPRRRSQKPEVPNQENLFPELIALSQPTDARSMSFVGTRVPGPMNYRFRASVAHTRRRRWRSQGLRRRCPCGRRWRPRRLTYRIVNLFIKIQNVLTIALKVHII